MRWSQKKRQLEALLASCLQDRVHYHVARYGPGISSSQARAWVTLDGTEIASMSTAAWENAEHELRGQDIPAGEAAVRLMEAGLFRRGHFEEACDALLNSSIETALESSDPLVRALACFDRRAGRRRLRRLQLTPPQHPLVANFLQRRLEAEHMGELAPTMLPPLAP